MFNIALLKIKISETSKKQEDAPVFLFFLRWRIFWRAFLFCAVALALLLLPN
jgi:hypothetical protein